LHAHVRAGFDGQAAVNAHEIQLAGEIFAAVAAEKHCAGIGPPAEHRVVGRMYG